MNYRDREFIEKLANAVLETFEIELPIKNMESVVDKLGGKIVLSRELSQYGDGQIEATKESTFVITIPENQPNKRKRFTIAHELGHLFLHMGYCLDESLWQSNAGNTYHRSGETKEEHEAHAFAAALLMPEDLYSEIIEKNQDELKRVDIGSVADYFDVSVSAATNRGKWLGYFKW